MVSWESTKIHFGGTLPDRKALDAIADYINAKSVADSYPADKDTEATLDALASKAITALKNLASA